MKAICVIATIVLLASCAAGAGDRSSMLEFSYLNPLPDEHGFAGAFVGVSSDALIAAGGANFPDGPPWDGHAKVWHDRIFRLADPDGQWQELPTRLPRPIGYGACVSWQREMICLGGGDATRHFDDVFSIRWDGRQIRFDTMTSLPTPLAMHCAAVVGDTLYVAGGIAQPDSTLALGKFYAIDLSQPADKRQWRELPGWPGPPRMLAAAAACDGKFYLLGGAQLIAGKDGKTTRKFLADAYCYDPAVGWKKLADMPRALAAAPSPAWVHASAIYIVGGDDGSLFNKQSELRDRHPGFCRDAMCYRPIANVWSSTAIHPSARSPLGTKIGSEEPNYFLPVTTGAVMWRNSYVLTSGEIRPATRTRQVLRFTMTERTATEKSADK